jgi:protein-tyrosine phosphatase
MVTDFHSHILPGMDDGSADVAESLAMLRMEVEQGIGHVVATPHFYARYDNPDHFLEKRDRAERLLREAMAAESGLPEITVGAEVYFFRGMSESEFLPRLTIGSESCILIEMPHGHWTEEMYRELAAVWEKRRILPILAHIDRYIRPFHARKVLQKLEQLPVLVQANADFFLERSTAGLAMRMLKEDRIQLLGSDCHNMDSRKPNLGSALERIEKKLGSEVLDAVRKYEHEVLGI